MGQQTVIIDDNGDEFNAELLLLLVAINWETIREQKC